jgi:MraZ protein
VDLTGFRGKFNVTLDEKGRFMVPAKLKAELNTDTLVVTEGLEDCLWIFMPSAWDDLVKSVEGDNSIFNVDEQDVMRFVITPAEEVSIDKSGRIKLPPPQVEAVELVKDCCLVGMGDRIEMWNKTRYDEVRRDRKSGCQEYLETDGPPRKREP